MSLFHVPVLRHELLELACGVARVVDGTLGDGGHSAAFLEAGAEVLAVDRDPEAVERARRRLGTRRIRYLVGNVFDPEILAKVDRFQPDLILLDLGVSSRQLDDARLGFTFRPGAPLDMRMSRGRHALPGSSRAAGSGPHSRRATIWSTRSVKPWGRGVALASSPVSSRQSGSLSTGSWKGWREGCPRYAMRSRPVARWR
jgi:hypothetical protein